MTGLIRTSLVIVSAGLLGSAALAQPSTPRDPKAPIPGVVDGRGPTGPVELKILAPQPNEVIAIPAAGAGQPPAKGAPVEVKFELKGIETFQDPTTKSGQAIAIFLDRLPFFSHYDATKPWFFKNVPKGTHTLRAVVVRPWNESIKEPSAFAMVTFTVGEKDGKNTPEPGEPVLTVVQPRRGAKYTAVQAQKLSLDFIVTGCTVGEESQPNSCRVRYKLDDKPETILTKSDPVSWEGLAAGKHAYVVGVTRGVKVAPGDFALDSGTFEIEQGGLMTPPAADSGTSSIPAATTSNQPGPGGVVPEPTPKRLPR